MDRSSSPITRCAPWSPRPPHSVLFRVRICAFPPFESTPLSPDWQNFWTPFHGLFAGFSCLGDPPKSKTLLNVPPIFILYNPLFKFLRSRRASRERERKKHPFFKRNLRVKSQIPPFFFFTILGPDFVARKVPLYRRFWEHAMRSLRPRSGGGGGGSSRPFTPFRKLEHRPVWTL